MARIAAIAMLLWALGEHSYGYYTLVRWVVFGVAGYLSFSAARRAAAGWAWLFGVTALLFNPLWPVLLGREIWRVVDLVVAAVLVISLVADWRLSSYSVATHAPPPLGKDTSHIPSSGLPFTLVRVGAAALLLWSSIDESHRYVFQPPYEAVGIAMGLTLGYGAFRADLLERRGWTWSLGVPAFLFWFQMGDVAWPAIHLIAAVMLLISIPVLRESKQVFLYRGGYDDAKDYDVVKVWAAEAVWRVADAVYRPLLAPRLGRPIRAVQAAIAPRRHQRFCELTQNLFAQCLVAAGAKFADDLESAGLPRTEKRHIRKEIICWAGGAYESLTNLPSNEVDGWRVRIERALELHEKAPTTDDAQRFRNVLKCVEWAIPPGAVEESSSQLARADLITEPGSFLRTRQRFQSGSRAELTDAD